jgi:hypothetical protein
MTRITRSRAKQAANQRLVENVGNSPHSSLAAPATPQTDLLANLSVGQPVLPSTDATAVRTFLQSHVRYVSAIEVQQRQGEKVSEIPLKDLVHPELRPYIATELGRTWDTLTSEDVEEYIKARAQGQRKDMEDDLSKVSSGIMRKPPKTTYE